MATGSTTMTIKKSGLLKKSEAKKILSNYFKAVKNIAAEKLNETVVEAKVENAKKVNSAFKVKRPVFTKAWRGRVYNKIKDRLPMMQIHNSIWWFNAHEKNTTLKSKTGKYMVIPFANINGKRIGLKAWKNMIAKLMANDQSFVKKSRTGKLILYATHTKENRKLLAKSKMAYRNKTGKKKIGYDTAVPIAILHRIVRTKQRYDVVAYNEVILPKILKPKLDNAFNNII